MTSVSTRRAFLKSAPAAIVSSAVLPASAYAASTSSALNMPVVATPALVEAHSRLIAALSEQREAKDALEWLADEWRHLWPLAPEEILWGAYADRYGSQDKAERDIIGNFIFRDTSVLTERLSAEFRAKTPRTCFGVEAADELQKKIDWWKKDEPTARTDKALAKKRASRAELIQEYGHKVTLARKYEAETERLRQAAGVARARQRIQDAQREVASAHRNISTIPATNLKDLIIKGESIMNDDLVKAVSCQGGILGQMARFIQDAVDLSWGASS